MKQNGKFVALANCNLNFSNWKVRFILNIHDFVVHSKCRKQGVVTFLLRKIEDYVVQNNICKPNLEIRTDYVAA